MNKKKHNVGNGQFMTVDEISKVTGLSVYSVNGRISSGKTGKELIVPRKRRVSNDERYDIGDGRKLTVQEISRIFHLKIKTVRSRIDSGKTGRELTLETRYNDKHDIGDGRKLTTREISKIAKVSIRRINERLAAGKTGKELMSGPNLPGFKGKKHDIGNGQLLTAEEISKISNLQKNTIYKRIKAGKTGKDLILPEYKDRYDVGNGQMMTAKEIAEKVGVSTTAIYHRIKNGKTGKELLTVKNKPTSDKGKKYDVGNNQFLTVNEICSLTGLSKNTIYVRIKNGKTGKDLIAKNYFKK